MNTLKEKYMYLFDINGMGVSSSQYEIIVDNVSANSHNINIDKPIFSTTAYSKAEAIGIMMLSDFKYKNMPIIDIKELT